MYNKVHKLDDLQELANYQFPSIDVLTDLKAIDKRDSIIRIAKLTNKFVKILFKGKSGVFEIERKVVATTLNHVLFSPFERLPKKCILNVELIN